MDPLLVVDGAKVCTVCGGGRRDRKNCDACMHTGFERIDLSGKWSRPAFLVCGGPSLANYPLEKLRGRGVMSLGVNNAAAHAPCTAFTFGDGHEKFHHALYMDPKVWCFVPDSQLRKNVRAKFPDGSFRNLDLRICDCPMTFGVARSGRFYADDILNTWFLHWGYAGKHTKCMRLMNSNTCMYCGDDVRTKKKADQCVEREKALPPKPHSRICSMMLGFPLLHYLGCKRVYMLGVDGGYEGAKYAWKEAKSGGQGEFAKINSMLRELAPVFSKAGFEVYNCFEKSRFDAFPYRSFDDALADCQGGIPEEPLDLDGWYGKKIKAANAELYPKPVNVETLLKELR